MDNFEGGEGGRPLSSLHLSSITVTFYVNFLVVALYRPPTEDDEESNLRRWKPVRSCLYLTRREGAQKSTARGALFPRITPKVGRATVVWEAGNLENILA